METRINYIAVGVFVLVFGFALLALAVWLGTDIAGRDYVRYSVYFSESVSGLSRNANVNYRGVNVGRVAELRIAPHNPRLVHVVLEIQPATPIRADTVAMLRMQGVTGIAEIELSGTDLQAPPPPWPPGEPYPVITGGPSLLSRLESALTSSMQTLDVLAQRVSQLIAPENLEALAATLHHLETITATLAHNRASIERSLGHAERLLAQSADATANLTPLLADMQQTLSTFQTVASAFSSAGEDFGALAREGRAGIAEFSRSSLPQLNRAIEEVHALADSLSRLAQELREQPEMLLFGRPQPPAGPGE